MLNVIESVRVAFILAPVMPTFASPSPAVAPPKATVFVNAPEVPAPPLPAPASAMLKAAEGIVEPLAAPVRADVLLAKYAYTPTAVRPGFRTHLVVATTLLLPALAALPALNVKLTVAVLRLTVRDSARVAFKAIGCAVEFNCADAIEAAKVIARTTTATRTSVPVLIDPPWCFRLLAPFFLSEGAVSDSEVHDLWRLFREWKRAKTVPK